MWRRVSCEQPLHTSQSILSPRGNPMQMPAFIYVKCPKSTGRASGERESGPHSGTRSRNRFTSGPRRKAHARRGNPT